MPEILLSREICFVRGDEIKAIGPQNDAQWPTSPCSFHLRAFHRQKGAIREASFPDRGGRRLGSRNLLFLLPTTRSAADPSRYNLSRCAAFLSPQTYWRGLRLPAGYYDKLGRTSIAQTLKYIHREGKRTPRLDGKFICADNSRVRQEDTEYYMIRDHGCLDGGSRTYFR